MTGHAHRTGVHWLRDTLQSDAPRVRKRLQSINADPGYGSAITADLRDGLSTLPIWMQIFQRDMIANSIDEPVGAQPINRQIDEGADLCRRASAFGVDDMDRQRFLLIAGKHGL